MKIYHKLALGFFSTSLIVAAATCISLVTNRGIQHDITQITQSSLDEVESATEMVITLQTIQTATQELLAEKYKGFVEVEYAAQSVEELTEIQVNIGERLKQFEAHLVNARKATKAGIKLNTNIFAEVQEIEEEKEELELLDQVQAEFSVHKKLIEQYLIIFSKDPGGAKNFLDKALEPHFKKEFLPLIRAYETDAELELTREAEEVENSLINADKIIISSTLVTLLIAILLSRLIALSIASPIVKLKNAVVRIGKGSLDIKVNIVSDDEIRVLANSFNKMVEDLRMTTVSKVYVDNIFSSMVDSLIVVNLDTTIRKVNQATLNLLGYEESELISKPIEFLFTEGTVTEVDTLLQKGFVGSVETTYLTKEGRKIPVSFSASVIRDEQGNTQGFVYVAQNITERKRAEEALQESEQMLQLVTDNIPQFIFWKDRNSVYLGCNRNFAQAAGLGNPENIVGKTDYNLPWKKEESNFFRECDRRVMETDTPEYHIIEPLLQANGEQAWLDTNKVPLHDLGGNVIGILGTFDDITERKRVEEALRQAEAKYRNIFENATEGIFQSTPEGYYLNVNPALARIYGYQSPDELLTKLSDIGRQLYVEPDRRAEFNRLMQEHDTVSDFESQIYRKNGSVIWISENARAVYDISGALSYYEGSVEDITERKQTQEQLRHNTLHDALTGLPNRTLFTDRLEQMVQQARRHKDYLCAVLFLDLDRFKVVNDSLGHLIGDQLLIAVARRLEVCLRAEDTVARLGGDEFAILLNDVKDVNYATQIAERLKQVLALPFNLSGQEVFTSVSIGIVFGSEANGWLDDLLRNADIAMYHAKTLGNGHCKIFDTALHDQTVTSRQLETDLRQAIDRQEFRVHYQPIVLLATGKVVGFEALVRWEHPTQGIISPAEFISIAEETGLILPLGQWVLQVACHQMRQWQRQFPFIPLLTISVNLSAKQFTQPNLCQQIAQILLETNLDASSLRLEITESILMDKAESVTTVLLQLKALGVSLYLDDFGTGYSSLSYLHRFPIDTLKIDRSFISRMGFGNENSEIVRAITTLAQALNMDVIAEGIETAEQLIQLSALQCKYGQGYFFSRPLDTQAAGALIAERLGGMDKSYFVAEYLDIK